MRLLGLILLIVMVLVASFLLLGGHRFFSAEETLAFFDRYRAWAVPIGFGLMLADLVLPVPSSAILSWYGQTYGTLVGGLIGTGACVAASLAAYGLSRLLGHAAAERIAGREDLERTRGFFSRWGSLAVACSRPVPMLAEVVSCLAGLSRMPFGRFLAANIVGSLPFAFAFAHLGTVGRLAEEPLQTLALAFFIPMLLWIPVAIALSRKKPPAPSEP